VRGSLGCGAALARQRGAERGARAAPRSRSMAA